MQLGISWSGFSADLTVPLINLQVSFYKFEGTVAKTRLTKEEKK